MVRAAAPLDSTRHGERAVQPSPGAREPIRGVRPFRRARVILALSITAALALPLPGPPDSPGRLGAAAAEAAPIAVRLPEGNARGFLVVRTADGEVLGHGEWRQKPVPGLIESHFALIFKDGSRREETVVYSQARVFRLESYRLVQRGPSFPTWEIAFDRASGRYTARTQERKGGEEEASAGSFEMPPDLYNGMDLVLLKNLADGESASGQMVVFTPRPRLLRMSLLPEPDERVRLGAHPVAARRYLVKLEVGGLTGVIASMIGKVPPDSRYWLATGEVPAFLRFEGAMFLNGPVWRVEMTTVEWLR
jgi:hypothetical protein